MRRVVTPIVIVVAGFALAFVLLNTGPSVAPRPPTVSAPLVRALDVALRTVRMRVSTHGTVVPRSESELVPEASGRETMRGTDTDPAGRRNRAPG